MLTAMITLAGVLLTLLLALAGYVRSQEHRLTKVEALLSDVERHNSNEINQLIARVDKLTEAVQSDHDTLISVGADIRHMLDSLKRLEDRP